MLGLGNTHVMATNASCPHQDAFEAQAVGFDFRNQRPQDELTN